MAIKTGAQLAAQRLNADPADMFNDLADTLAALAPRGAMSASFAIPAQSLDMTITVTLFDWKGDAITVPLAMDVWLSDSADGTDLTINAPNQGFTVVNGGNLEENFGSSDHLKIIVPSGTFGIRIQDAAGGDTYYLVVKLSDYTLAVSSAFSLAGGA